MNRKLHNTFFALSISAVLLTAGLIAAQPLALDAPTPTTIARTRIANPPVEASESVREAKAIEQAAQARAVKNQAVALGEPPESRAELGEAIGHIAGLTTEAVTEAALVASLSELSRLEYGEFNTSGAFDEVQAIDADTTRTSPPRRQQRSRRSQAMPYFSFASRG